MDQAKKILVVDDDPRNRELLEALLTPLGYQTLMAENGEDALEQVRLHAPDLILLDVMMPGLDGFEVTRRLKGDERTRSIPVVMVTALQNVEHRIEALEAGANDFMSKPVDRAELQATVQSQMQVKAYHDHMKNYQEELEAEVAQRTRQLNNTLAKLQVASLDTICRLSRAAEYKDDDTGAHIKRMSNYSAMVARQMGLNDKVVETILYASPMHDVGKIGTPDHILLKPGKLDPEEWVVMKQHTTIGGKILEGADSGFLKLAEVIALTHHEKWDGNGYPRGLKATEIPLAGRIVAIADVFDALTSKRPYKEAFSVEKSYQIIREGRGNHFDPAVVDAFFAIQDELLSVKEKYTDEGQSLLFQTVGVTS
ncbi:MAG: two-component system response regulator [Proteobacteria bacterium]|nr:two-component system response regulator [Pseudomonadota bacterium]MBU1741938.1 two-component system response regulator [Pseudomonadota bacterium]